MKPDDIGHGKAMTTEEIQQALDALPVGYNRAILREHIEALGAEAARLRAALKPFAEFARRWLEMTPNAAEDAHVYQANDAKLLARDLRAALKAMEGA